MPGRAFWGRLGLAEELGDLADDLELGLQLADSSPRCTQLCGLLRNPARTPFVVDVVLAQPLRQRDQMDAEVNGGLLLFFSCPHQRDGAGAELSGVGAGHVRQPFVKAVS
jgi:hypothetical protein